MAHRVAVIIGAGPAGLTAAHELLAKTDLRPILFEADAQVGGISRTVRYKGNRIDIGGHRFFSKSDRVMTWWMEIMPLQALPDGAEDLVVTYHNRQARIATGAPHAAPDPDAQDAVMLVRNRVSRILYGRKFYDYPLKLDARTLRNLGLARTARIIASYGRARLFPIRPERSLRDFIINRFGVELYETFFRDYTEKVWGVPCEDIPADWGAQRIKGVSISGLLRNMARKLLPRRSQSILQKDTETSLIERFLYPKHGPGQLWEVVADKVTGQGGELHLNHRVTGIAHDGERITGVTVAGPDGIRREVAADYVFSTMPVQDLLRGLAPAPPKDLRGIGDGLTYRDFVTVGLLLKRLTLFGGTSASELAGKVPDNWIYIQEPDVKVGRLQIFNNWSPYLVADPDTIWVGLEYFVNEGDAIWSKSDADLLEFAARELQALGVADPVDVLDGCVVRMPKTYPAYFGSYDRFGAVEAYLRGFQNLFCIGRNGMHRYNNQDHSILTAMIAVDGIAEGRDVRDEIWQVNTEEDYHESK